MPIKPVHIIIMDQGHEASAVRRRLRQTLLTPDEARILDYAVLDGKSLPAQELEASMRICPAVGTKRLIVIENGHRMHETCWEVIRRLSAQDGARCVLAVEVRASRSLDRIIRSFEGRAAVIRPVRAVSLKPFDLTEMMQSGDRERALRTLHRLLDDNQAPLQILGLLGWFWGKTGVRFPAAVRNKGWRILLKADEAIKRSRMPAPAALEYTILSLMQCLDDRGGASGSGGRRLRR